MSYKLLNLAAAAAAVTGLALTINLYRKLNRYWSHLQEMTIIRPRTHRSQ